EFFSSDVKVYTTIVSIDGTVQGLRPGMSAEVSVLAAEAADKVLVVPIQSVLGNVAMGAKRKVFVLDETGIAHERDIVVGMSNDKLVEVKDGLALNDKVVLSPKSLLNEKSNLHPGTPGGRRGAAFDEDGKDGKKKGGKKGGPGGPMGGGGPMGAGGMPPGGPMGGGGMPPTAQGGGGVPPSASPGEGGRGYSKQ